jgi:hypothetical protein
VKTFLIALAGFSARRYKLPIMMMRILSLIVCLLVTAPANAQQPATKSFDSNGVQIQFADR